MTLTLALLLMQSEVNRLEWTKKRLAELLPGAEACLEGGAATPVPLLTRVTALKSCTGEAMLTTRKGNKKFAFYDLQLTIAWEAVPAEAASAPAAAAGEAGEAAADGGAEATEQQAQQAAPAAQPGISGAITVGEFGSGSDHEDLELAFTVAGACMPSVCVCVASGCVDCALAGEAAWALAGACRRRRGRPCWLPSLATDG